MIVGKQDSAALRGYTRRGCLEIKGNFGDFKLKIEATEPKTDWG